MSQNWESMYAQAMRDIEGLRGDNARLREENERLRTALERVLFLIESLDPQLQRIDGDDGFIKGYRMNTGIWHKLLAWARDDHRAALQEVQP